MKEKNLFDLHKKWSKSNNIDGHGLCGCVPNYYKKSLALFNPNHDEEGYTPEKGMSLLYWAFGEACDVNDNFPKWFKYSPLRQTIVLFICAIHNEIL